MLKKITAVSVKLFLIKITRISKDKRGEGLFPSVIVMEFGNSVYKVGGYFKENGTATISEKLLRLMKIELEKEESLCYNGDNTNSLKSLDCKPERSGI